MILPEELYELVKEKLESDDAVLKYARVFMSLLDVVSGDFFNQYCKAGNVLMVSEGRVGVDHNFSLGDGESFWISGLYSRFSVPLRKVGSDVVTLGKLRLELDKATYERCGLVGKVMVDQGRKHVKSRYGMTAITTIVAKNPLAVC